VIRVERLTEIGEEHIPPIYVHISIEHIRTVEATATATGNGALLIIEGCPTDYILRVPEQPEAVERMIRDECYARSCSDARAARDVSFT